MKLKINPYKGGLTAAAIAIAAVFYLGVWSNYESASGQRTGLEDKEKKIDLMMRSTASGPMVKALRDYQDALGKETTNCKDYYKGKGALLTGWFSGISIKPDGLPEPGEFKARYIDEKNQLIRKLKDNNVKIKTPEGADAAKAEDAQMGFEEPTPENLKNLQKRFWIQEMLVNAMKEAEALQCEKMTFAAVNAPPGGAGRGAPPPLAQAARLIPGNLGTVVSFELNVNLHTKKVPVLIRNILERSKEGFLVEIKKVELSRIADELANYPEFKSPEKQPSIAEKESYKPPALKPPMVKLTIQGEALDFDIK